MPSDFELTSCENVALSRVCAKNMYEQDINPNYPIHGKMGARVVGPAVLFFTSLIDSLFHACMTLLKAAIAIPLAPFNTFAICFIPSIACRSDFEISSVLIHMYRTFEKVFFAATLPIIAFFDPRKAYALTNWETGKAEKEDEIFDLKGDIVAYKEEIQKKDLTIKKREKNILRLQDEINFVKEQVLKKENYARIQIKNKDDELKQKEDDVLNLKNEINSVKEKNLKKDHELNMEIHNKEKTILLLRNEINSSKEKILKKDSETNDEIKKKNDEINKKEEKITNLQNEINSTKEQVIKKDYDFNSEILKINTEIKKKDEYISVLKNEINSAKEKILKKEKESNLEMQKINTDLIRKEEDILKLNNAMKSAKENMQNKDSSTHMELKKKDAEILHLKNEIRIRAQLPKYVFSRIGSLGNEHFMHYLKTEKPFNRDALILWSFSQRKFQSQGTLIDTIALNPNLITLGVAGPTIDEDGYAVALSAHSPHVVTFIKDELIKKIDLCVRYQVETTSHSHKLNIGFYEDGKCIIQQPGVRACVPTALSMVLTDRYVDFDYQLLYSTNLSNDIDLESWAGHYGYQLVPLKNDISSIQEWIEKNGSVLSGISDPTIGGHEIVVDSIDKDFTVIRDPAHGWRVTMSTKEFLETMNPSFTGIIKK